MRDQTKISTTRQTDRVIKTYKQINQNKRATDRTNRERKRERGRRPLGDVEGVEDENVLVVFGEGDDVALTGDFEATTATHLDVRTLKLANE